MFLAIRNSVRPRTSWVCRRRARVPGCTGISPACLGSRASRPRAAVWHIMGARVSALGRLQSGMFP